MSPVGQIVSAVATDVTALSFSGSEGTQMQQDWIGHQGSSDSEQGGTSQRKQDRFEILEM